MQGLGRVGCGEWVATRGPAGARLPINGAWSFLRENGMCRQEGIIQAAAVAALQAVLCPWASSSNFAWYASQHTCPPNSASLQRCQVTTPRGRTQPPIDTTDCWVERAAGVRRLPIRLPRAERRRMGGFLTPAPLSTQQ
ncbi:hypothetical protein E2C01_023015 [Portunus trituberculatus]|uniref:Uncharacterized protein n=1 Tax=Portunus trituberculatus TaxID=210409 RepID=A0A5B7E8T0_PORTR|nr:hypothetical protein [Portunus trituberculatus]